MKADDRAQAVSVAMMLAALPSSGMIVIWQWKPSRNKAGAYMKTSTNKDHRT